MAYLVEFVTHNNEPVLIEVQPTPGMEALADGGPDVVQRATQTFESALSTVKGAITSLLDMAGKISLPADTLEVELALKASAKAGFYLASANSEAQIKVKLVWNKKPKEENA